jgi:hypothetical protein
MSLPNITNYTAGYWGPSTVKNSLALLNPVADTGGTGQQQSQLTFYGVSTSGQGPTTPGQLGALTINRNPTGSATQNAGQAVLQLSSGTALSTVLTATSSLLTSAVTFSCANYDSSNSTVTFNVGGTPIFSLTSTSVTFNLAPSFPALTLAGTLYNSTSTLAFVVASTSVLSISTSGTLSLTGSAPILTATNTWSMQVAGTSVATLSTGEFALGTAIELSVPGTVAVSGTASATKLQVLDALSNPVLTVNTSTDKVSLAALQVTSFSSAGTVVSDSSGNLSIGGSGDTFNNTTLTGTTSVTGIIGVTGSASTGKLQVLDAGSAIVLGVDTTVDVVTAKALTVSSFSTAGPVVSSSAGVLSVSSTLAGITLTGTNTVTGTLGISGTASATKLQVLDASSLAVLTVNTSTDTVTVSELTVSSFSAGGPVVSSSGGVLSVSSTLAGLTLIGTNTVTGTLGISGTASATKLQVLDASSAAVLTVNTSTDIVTASALTVSGFSTAGPVVSSSAGVLSVSSTLAGITLTGTNTVTGTLGISGTASATKLQVLDASSATAFTVNTSTDAVTTKNNTLDNGSGSATFHNTVTAPLFSSNLSSSSNQLCLFAQNTGSGGVALEFETSAKSSLLNYDSTGWWFNDSMRISGSGTFGTGSGNVSINGSIVTGISQTGSNTFSTGTGNVSINGPIITNIAQTGTTTFSTGTGASTVNGSFYLPSLSTGLLLVNSSGLVSSATTIPPPLIISGLSNTALSVNNASSVTSFNVNTNTAAVSTLHNTLDDGSGNLTTSGSVTANEFIYSGTSSSNLVASSFTNNNSVGSLSEHFALGTNLGNIVFSSNGFGLDNALSVKTSAGSPAAFSVQNSTPSTLFAVDTSNSLINCEVTTQFYSGLNLNLNNNTWSGAPASYPSMPVIQIWYLKVTTTGSLGSNVTVATIALPPSITASLVINIQGGLYDGTYFIMMDDLSATRSWRAYAQGSNMVITTGPSYSSTANLSFYVWFWTL